jgi:hypothetical protein
MGRIKDLLIDEPCHWCGMIAMLTPCGTTKEGKTVLMCDECRCTNDSPEEERTNE